MQKNSDEKSFSNVRLNWYPGHMAKTKKQIIEDLKLIDIVIELLDARIPISSRNPDIQNIIGNKKRIIVLNKSDLADEKENRKWVNYFNNNNEIAILTDANSGYGINEVIKHIEKIAKEELEIYMNKGRVGKPIRVLILGIPNVGKSSFINRISKKTSAQVGNKPGITKQKQWIKVANNIELLDTPGVLWPKFESQQVALNLSYTGTIKDDILEKSEIAFYLLKFLLKNYKQNVITRYKLDANQVEEIMKNENQQESENILEIINQIGKKRGAIVSGGNVDENKVANILLEDFRTTKLGKISLEKKKRSINLKEVEEYTKKIDNQEVNLQSPLIWAYVGDAVYELYIRNYLATTTKLKPHKLHIESIKYVKAKAQAQILQELHPMLTNDEQEIVRRARNTKNHHLPKNAEVSEYMYSTAFEGLIGYLYLTKQEERLEEILKLSIQNAKKSE